MKMLLTFYFGWAMGARSGPEGLDDIKRALVSLRHSEEFQGLLEALRHHGGYLLRDIARRVEGADGTPIGVPDVLARIYDLVQRPVREPGSGDPLAE